MFVTLLACAALGACNEEREADRRRGVEMEFERPTVKDELAYIVRWAHEGGEAAPTGAPCTLPMVAAEDVPGFGVRFDADLYWTLAAGRRAPRPEGFGTVLMAWYEGDRYVAPNSGGMALTKAKVELIDAASRAVLARETFEMSSIGENVEIDTLRRHNERFLGRIGAWANEQSCR